MQIDSRIISNKKITKGYSQLKIEVPSVIQGAQPGQFLHMRINDFGDPLLRRPFSIHNLSVVKSKGKKIICDILYEIKGKGTSLLTEKQSGEYLNILGPLGRCFNYQKQNSDAQIDIIVAGGAGIAPLFFLAHKISDSKTNKRKSDKGKVVVLIGAATGSKILKAKELQNLSCDVAIATEDGSQGFKGRVTALLEKKILSKIDALAKKSSKEVAVNIYACGPMAMLTEVAKICKIKKIPLQVSLEEFMGCGIGACLGCAIETNTGYQRVCHDGPVFNAQDIVWKF